MPFNKETKPILDYNALDKRWKMFCVSTYMETKSFKTVQAKFRWKINFNNYTPKKPNLSMGT